MPRSANERLLDLATTHQIGILRYGAGVVRKVLSLLGELDDDIVGRVASRPPGGTRVDQMLASVRTMNRRAYKSVEDYLVPELRDLAESETEFQEKAILTGVGVDLDLASPTPATLRAIVTTEPFEGGLLGEWVEGMEQGRYDRLRQAVRISVASGETTDATVRRIRGTAAAGYRDGILEVSRRSAGTIVRTAVNHVATSAREHYAEANSDIIGSMRWVSTLDSRTSAVCRSRDGRIYPINEGPRPPAHLNCRSTMVPVVKSWRDLGIDLDEIDEGTRASVDGQVPASTTYAEWLAGRSAAEQDEILGVTKGRLYRKGGLTLDRFVDSTGREYTLAELRRRDAEAFTRAGLA